MDHDRMDHHIGTAGQNGFLYALQQTAHLSSNAGVERDLDATRGTTGCHWGPRQHDCTAIQTIMPPPGPGMRLGPYELISRLGVGGMGEVWKARDTRVGRIVAIKTSQRRLSNRFEREARAIASLNHPNICCLYDVGPDYLVLEFVDGLPIRPVRNLSQLLDLAVQIADGLAAAHAAGIVHRDLKPDNVLVTSDGRVKIVDFGLAKQDAGTAITDVDATRTAGATQPDMVLGTASYMSPEQARGVAVDTRSDQFSFGVMLYELISSKRPFVRDSAPQTMAAIIEAQTPLLPSAPDPLRWIIERCLAKEPSERYESTHDLYRDLRSVRDHISEVLHSGSAASVSPVPAPRRWLWPVAALLATMMIGAAGSWMGAHERADINYAARSTQDVVKNRPETRPSPKPPCFRHAVLPADRLSLI